MKKKLATVMLIAVLAVTTSLTSVFPSAKGGRTGTSGAFENVTEVTDRFDDALDISGIVSDEAKVEAFGNPSGKSVVMVELDGDSVADAYNEDLSLRGNYPTVGDYFHAPEAERLTARQQRSYGELLERLDKAGVRYELRYTYGLLFNGVSLEIANEDVKRVEGLKGVKRVAVSESYAVPQVDAVKNPVRVYSTGIYDSSDVPYDGTGMVVGILDTGFDYTHVAFTDMPASPRLSKSDIAENVDELAAKSNYVSDLTIDDVYISEKVPYAFDYADGDTNVFPVSSSHGTHVAGIIAGEDENKSFDDGTTFCGVAPEAQLAIFKVFADSDVGKDEGAQTDGILAAVSDATLLGVDVINMSLGTSAGFSREEDQSVANDVYDRVKAAGINLVVAAANSYSSALGGSYGSTNLTSNPDSGTIGSPSSYDSAISVASISGQLSPYMMANGETALYFGESSNSAGIEQHFVEELLGGLSSKTFSYVTIGGYGKSFNYTSEIKQKMAAGDCIALVKRGGGVSFEDKQRIAAENGAVGCIVYNNVSGTIRASLGTGKRIPTCTISMDMGALVSNRDGGTLLVSKDLKAGPFMSDFSSWGPTPDLKLKPEITAHGGDITSSVVGGYDKFSGTSMASPNLAGAVTLLREHVGNKYPELNAPGREVEKADRVYQLLMSAATVAYNQEGNPYSPRKQGAGLANIYNAMNTDAFLYVDDYGKTKLELGDDKEKTGVYTLRFNVSNTSDKVKTYDLETMTMTETLSSDGITVAEKAFMLGGGKVAVSVDGAGSFGGKSVTVQPEADAAVTVRITLSADEKRYLNETFENGMFVEGFVRLNDTDSENAIDLSIPWLAFYGDWLAAPMFDATEFEVSADRFDDSVPDEEKTRADVYASLPIGRYYKGSDMLLPMGKYVFNMPEDGSYEEVPTTMDRVALSYDENGIYELYGYYAGMMRGAKKMKVEITDVATGEILYTETLDNVRKSYGAGSGVSYPAFNMLEMSAKDLGLSNNSQYKVSFTGALDYEGGENVTKNTQEFYFYIDFERPTIKDYQIRTSYDSAKNRRVYLDLYLFDNNYVECVQIFSPVSASNINYLTTEPIPVYGNRNSVNKVTVEITKWMDNFASAYGNYENTIGVTVLDYALNGGAFMLPMKYSEMESFDIVDKAGQSLDTVQMKVGDVFDFSFDFQPETADYADVVYETSDKTGLIEIENNQIYAKKAGSTKVIVTSKSNPQVYKMFDVTVAPLGADETPPEYPVQKLTVDSYTDLDKTVNHKITGDALTLDADAQLQFFAKIKPWYADEIRPEWSSSNRNVATIDPETGVLTCLDEGTSLIQVKYYIESLHMTLSASVTVTFKDEFKVENAKLYEYNGAGGQVLIPANLGITELTARRQGDPGPFYQNKRIDTVVVPESVTTLGLAAFAYSTVREIYLPSTLKSISSNAFEGCTRLEKVYWLKDVEYNDKQDKYVSWVEGVNYTEDCTALAVVLGSNAFYKCTALTQIDTSRVSGMFPYAFSGCTSLTEADISEVSYAGKNVYWKCTSLKNIKTSRESAIGPSMFDQCAGLTEVTLKTASVSDYMFRGCSKLRKITFENNMSRIGSFAFDGCSALSEVVFRGSLETIDRYAFSECTSLTSFTLPDGLSTLGINAFYNDSALAEVVVSNNVNLTQIGETPFRECTALTDFVINNAGGNTRYYTTVERDGCSFLYTRDLSRIVFAPVAYKGETDGYVFEDGITEIGAQAYASFQNGGDTLVIPEGVTRIGERAFANNSALKTVVLPESLVTLDALAFYSCTSLETVVFRSDLKRIDNFTFYGCYNLKNVELPESLEEIGFSAFRFCTSMKNFEVPENVRVIEGWAFASDIGLESISFGANSRLSKIDEHAFDDCELLDGVALPASVRYLGNYAFNNCFSATRWEIPALEYMGAYVFCNNYSLESATFAEGTQMIGSYAFAYLKGSSIYFNAMLTELNVPASVTTIQPYALAALDGIKSLDLSGVEYIGDYGFAGARNLTTVTLGSGIQYIGTAAFRESGITSIDLSHVRVINSYAFDATKLTSVDLSSLEQLGGAVFRNCTGLTEVSLPKCFVILDMAFYGCANLVKADIPAVQILGTGAFFGTGLTQIALPACLTQIDDTAFNNSLKLTAINVDENNPVYFSEDGVVYRRLTTQGYELVQYPNGKADVTYEILDGTVRVGAWSMAYAARVVQITLPASVKSVGAYAFYGCGLTVGNIRYVFRSLNAPILEGEYNSALSASDAASMTNIYGNFTYKFGYVQSSVIVPENGVGYNNFVYATYFKPPVYASSAVEQATENVIAAIAALPETVTLEQKDAIAALRASYDGLNDRQKALVSNYARLVEAEKDVAILEANQTPEGDKNGCNSSALAGGAGAAGIVLLAVGAALLAVRRRKA